MLSRILLLGGALLAYNIAYAKAGEPLPAEAWHRKAVGFSIGLYYLKTPASDPAKAARALAGDKRFALTVVDRLDKAAHSQALLGIHYSTNVAAEYAPPSLDSLRYFGRGLTLEQSQALQRAPRALILSFAHPTAQSAAGLRRAEEFILELAKHHNAIIWDDETREAFTPEAWEANRVQTWDGGTPNVAKQIVIHAYNSDGHTRAISLGMARFGLPDLVISDSVWSLSHPLGNTINAVAQHLIEIGPPDEKGVLRLKISALRHAGLRKSITDGILSGGTGEGHLNLLEAQAEAGDPNNALAALDFESYPGRDFTERQSNFVIAVFGAQPDEVVYTKHDTALRAASDRARAQLPDLQKAFLRGLQPGEQLLVKAPFSTKEGGSEWMWVEVIEWKGEQIKGMLRSEPRHVPGLKTGQTVDVRQADLFDFLRVFSDGRTEGNETSKILKDARR